MAKSLKKLALPASHFRHLEQLQWVVTEKIHGANFSFVYQDKHLRFAKRKSYLKWSDDFFGFQYVVHQIEDAVMHLMEDLKSKFKADKYLVYGELFGGDYPHPNTAPHPDFKAIQTGIYYAPVICFCAFDTAIEAAGKKTYLDYEYAINIFEKHKIFFAKPLYIGTLNQASNFDTKINSRIPEQLNLPLLDSNLIEGVVIKPYSIPKNFELENRPIFKLKNKAFEEQKKYHLAEKWSFKPSIESKTEALNFLLDAVGNYINANRLQAAISKTGGLDFSNIHRLKAIEKEFTEDILQDFNEDNEFILDLLSKAQKQWLRTRLTAIANLLISNQQEK